MLYTWGYVMLLYVCEKEESLVIKKTKIKFADGTEKTQIRVIKSIRCGEQKKPKQITVKSFGYLEDQTNLEEFWDEVRALDENMHDVRKKNIVLTIPTDIQNNAALNKDYNYGYRYIEAVLKALRLDEFFNTIPFKGEHSLYDIFEFLVIQRILDPASKRRTIQNRDRLYGKHYDFELQDIYRALDKIAEESVPMQVHINKRIKELIGRDGELSFYDVTNYYFTMDFNGGPESLLKKGVSKEHQLTPIVQFGLFMDTNNIPIAMKAYPGNTSDALTLQPAMEDVKKDFHLGRLIVVADKGMNSSSNIDYICNHGDGYVVSQTLRGNKGVRYKDDLFDPNGYEGNEEFRYKLIEEEYESHINSKKIVKRRRKVLMYWSKADAEYAKAKRMEKVRKAEIELTNNVYTQTHSKQEYVATQYFNSATGETADSKVSGINYDKITEEEKYDGYFCILTSELDYNAQKILDTYHNLWHIEESFRVTKSDLNTRPIYVYTNAHIEAHLLTCFVALTVLRVLQYKLRPLQIPAARIAQTMAASICRLPEDDVVWVNEVHGGYSYKEENGKASLELNEDDDYLRNDWLALQKSFGVDLDFVLTERNIFDKRLNGIKLRSMKNGK